MKPPSGALARWVCKPPASYRPLPKTNLHYREPGLCTSPPHCASPVRENLQVSLRVNFAPENRGIDFARSGKPALAYADSGGITMLRHRSSTFRTRHSARLIVAQGYPSRWSSLHIVLNAACAAITELHALPIRWIVDITTDFFCCGDA